MTQQHHDLDEPNSVVVVWYQQTTKKFNYSYYKYVVEWANVIFLYRFCDTELYGIHKFLVEHKKRSVSMRS